jgi:hypothetical protein
MQHNIFQSMVFQQEIVVNCPPVICCAIKLIAAGKYICPVLFCAGNSSKKWSLRQHFNGCHPQDLVVIPSKGTVPPQKCKRCEMQTEPGALYLRHQRNQLCQDGWDRKVQHEATETARIALAQSFTAYGDELERVEVFKYLVWLLAYNDNDTQAMRANLAKAHKSRGQVSCVLRAKNASPKVCGMFYTATKQAKLLFGSDLWKLSPSSLKSLEGFHTQAAHRMAGKKLTRNFDGMWTYPSLKDVLKEVGLWTINHYIGVCWETIACFIVDQPLFALCRDWERKRGSTRCTFWWEQPMLINVEESLLGDEGDIGDDY